MGRRENANAARTIDQRVLIKSLGVADSKALLLLQIAMKSLLKS